MASLSERGSNCDDRGALDVGGDQARKGAERRVRPGDASLGIDQAARSRGVLADRGAYGRQLVSPAHLEFRRDVARDREPARASGVGDGFTPELEPDLRAIGTRQRDLDGRPATGDRIESRQQLAQVSLAEQRRRDAEERTRRIARGEQRQRLHVAEPGWQRLRGEQALGVVRRGLRARPRRLRFGKTGLEQVDARELPARFLHLAASLRFRLRKLPLLRFELRDACLEFRDARQIGGHAFGGLADVALGAGACLLSLLFGRLARFAFRATESLVGGFELGELALEILQAPTVLLALLEQLGHEHR